VNTELRSCVYNGEFKCFLSLIDLILLDLFPWMFSFDFLRGRRKAYAIVLTQKLILSIVMRQLNLGDWSNNTNTSTMEDKKHFLHFSLIAFWHIIALQIKEGAGCEFVSVAGHLEKAKVRKPRNTSILRKFSKKNFSEKGMLGVDLWWQLCSPLTKWFCCCCCDCWRASWRCSLICSENSFLPSILSRPCEGHAGEDTE